MTRAISIVIPAYNEESRLPETLRKIETYFATAAWEQHEIIVVDDGSSDSTVAGARAFASEHLNIRVLNNPGNRGKGYSVRHGMLDAKFDWCLFSDADLSTPIEELDKLWAAIVREGAQVAISSRALDRSLVGVHQSAFREASGRFFNAVMRLTIGLPIADTQCGFKLFRRDVAREAFKRQTLERWGSTWRCSSSQAIWVTVSPRFRFDGITRRAASSVSGAVPLRSGNWQKSG